MKPSLLIIDDDDSILRTLHQYFRSDYDVHIANGGKEGFSIFQKILPLVVTLDLQMSDMHGLEVLEKIKAMEPDVPVIMLTGHGDIETAVQSMKLGADHFLTKPIDLQALDSILIKSISIAKLQKNYQFLKEKLNHHKEKLVLDLQTQRGVGIMASNPDTTVLIAGPTGSGKGVLARLIHRESSRKESPFLEINCAGLSRELLESELFGYERGAFTDAKTQKKGLMEVADGGSLFLDEIGEMSPSVQAKILTAIETKSFRRIGGTTNIEVDVRIIAATNSDLLNNVRKGKFREDLYYRINVLPLTLLPLAERKEDIPTLAALFLDEFTDKMNKNIDGFTKEVISVLTDYLWPGNIRELKNVIERATILCEGNFITIHHLPAELRDETAYRGHTENIKLVTMEEAEKRQIVLTLAYTENNKAAAARILNIDISTLARKIKKYQTLTR